MRARSTCVLLAMAVSTLVSCTTGSDASDGAHRSGPTSAEVDNPTDEASAMFAGISADDPFCSAAVLEGDEVVFARAFGSIDGERTTTDSEVDIASVSKQFTGVAIELLVARGELSGTDLVGTLVPASSPATDDVTVDELLVHTSGLPDYGDLLAQDLDEPASQSQAVAAIAQSEPGPPRGSFDYSNSNYVLLAEVVRSVTDTPLADFLDAEVFEPTDLDMDLGPRGPWQQVGDGSIWTTPTELVRWSSQYWDQTLDGPDLVTAMFEPEANASEDGEATDDTYGSGVLRGSDVDGTRWLYHDGSWDRHETDWALIPDERLAAAVTCDVDAEPGRDVSARELVELWRS